MIVACYLKQNTLQTSLRYAPQEVKFKNGFFFFAVNYSAIHNMAKDNFYLNLWAMEDFLF